MQTKTLSKITLADGAGHTFFEQAVLEGQVSDDLLQGRRLTAQGLDLVGRGGPRRVSRQPALASLKELLRPDIIEALGDALLAADLGDAVLAAEAIQHDPDLVFGGEMPPRRAPDVLRHLLARRRLRGQGFGSHLRSYVTAMRPKPSSKRKP